MWIQTQTNNSHTHHGASKEPELRCHLCWKFFNCKTRQLSLRWRLLLSLLFSEPGKSPVFHYVFQCMWPPYIAPCLSRWFRKIIEGSIFIWRRGNCPAAWDMSWSERNASAKTEIRKVCLSNELWLQLLCTWPPSITYLYPLVFFFHPNLKVSSLVL